MIGECGIDANFHRPALAVRARTPLEGLPGVLAKAYAAVGGYLGRLGECPAGPPFCAYHNMDMADLDITVGFPVARPLNGSAEIHAIDLPQRAATCLHLGPYAELAATYEALTRWIQAQGLTPSGVAYEFYLNDPAQTPPESLQTLIAFALQEA